MCGICGVYLFDGERTVSEATIDAMRDTMVHRGPDGAGSYVRGHVGLGHRRLSIVDVAGGHQPMSNEDGSVWISYNGEVYNHADLRPGLEARGHVFRTRSDTEALVHLYEAEGTAGLEHLCGMFAFAIYDERRDVLFLARDRMGVKPLYYHELGGRGVVFASEMKAILAHPEVRAEVDWEQVPGLLRYGSVYGEPTLFRGIRELPPGHWMMVGRGGIEVRRYWDLPAGGELEDSEAEQRERIEALLRQAVRRRLMSDVPLGAFLSGGLDSSLIVAMMSEMTAEPVKTFSIGFAEAGYNEFPYSRFVVERFKTDHTEIVLDSSEFFGALPRLVWHYDEPVALPASVPLYFLSQATKSKATVILTGEGADEVFLGYEQYPWAHRQARVQAAFRAICPAFARPAVVRGAKRLLGKDRLLFDRLGISPGALAASFTEWVAPVEVNQLGPFAAERAVAVCEAMFDAGPRGRDFMSRMTYLDFKAFLVTLLMKQDKMSMAASIESRVPFLDHDLVEYGFRVPTDRKLRGWRGKAILKDVAAKYFPPDFIDRRKQGFPVPVTAWVQHPSTKRQFEEVLLDPRSRARGVFDPQAVERLLARRGGEGEAPRWLGYLLWTLVNFELWQRVFIDGGGRAGE